MDYFCAFVYEPLQNNLMNLAFSRGSGMSTFLSLLRGNGISMLFLYLTCFAGMFCSECCVVFHPMGFMGFAMELVILVHVSFIPLLSYVQKRDRINGRRHLCPSFEQNIGLCKKSETM